MKKSKKYELEFCCQLPFDLTADQALSIAECVMVNAEELEHYIDGEITIGSCGNQVFFMATAFSVAAIPAVTRFLNMRGFYVYLSDNKEVYE